MLLPDIITYFIYFIFLFFKISYIQLFILHYINHYLLSSYVFRYIKKE